MNPITRARRLSVARAWEGHPDVDGFRLETRRWAQTGLVVDADSAGLERLAQLVADAAAGAASDAAGFVPQSRLLAAEAELGRVKAELARLAERWHKRASDVRADGEGAQWTRVAECLEDCADEALAAAPPSPPVAPEPAQENQGPSGQKENDEPGNDRSSIGQGPRELDGDETSVGGHLAKAGERRGADGPVLGAERSGEGPGPRDRQDGALGGGGSRSPEVSHSSIPSSGEAAGDGVTLKLEHVLKATIKALSGTLPTDDELYDTAQATIEKLQKSRDAERAQKEALRVELETALGALGAWELEARSLAADVIRAEEHGRLGARDRYMVAAAKRIRSIGFDPNVAALPAQQPAEAAPVAKVGDKCDSCLACVPQALARNWMRLCPTCGNKRCPRATYHGHECSGSNEPGQPGSAYAFADKPVQTSPFPAVAQASVAKGEATVEPAGWVPGQRVRWRTNAIKPNQEPVDLLCLIKSLTAITAEVIPLEMTGERWQYTVALSNLTPVEEPAPQPPAADSPVMRSELVAALRKAEDKAGVGCWSAFALAEFLANELEGIKL